MSKQLFVSLFLLGAVLLAVTYGCVKSVSPIPSKSDRQQPQSSQGKNNPL